MSPKQHHHPPDVLRPWVDARQDDVSVMPKARAAPNVSQKKRRRKRPVSLPQPREPCRRGVCPQVCRASHSALVKARGTCRQRPRAQGGGGESFHFLTQVGSEAMCVGNSAAGPHSQPWGWTGLGARRWGGPESGREPRGRAWTAGGGAPSHRQPPQGLPAALISHSLTPKSRIHFLFNPPINPINILINHSSPPR